MAHRRKISWHRQKPTPGSQPDPAHPSRYQLALDLPFLEGGGLTAKDYSPWGNNGTLTGGVTWGVGRSGKCLSFDGTGYVNCGVIPAALNLTHVGGVTVWANPNTISQVTGIVCVGDVTVASTNCYGINTDGATHKLQAVLGNAAANNTLTINPAAWVAGAWVHLAMVWDGAKLNYYINGSLFSSMNQTIDASPAGKILRIGANGAAAPGSFFIGLIDSPKIYARAPSASEILADYTAPWAGWSPTPTRRRMQGTVAGGLLLRRRREACLR